MNVQEKIDAIFEASENQEAAAVAVYTMTFPDWEKIVEIDGWPACGEKMHNYLFKKFIHLDREHHPEVMAGGLWMNRGFSINRKLGDWEIDVSQAKIKLGR